jgi:hypothetical protein
MKVILAIAVAGCLVFSVQRCYAAGAVDAGREASLTEEEQGLIEKKIVNFCVERVFWVPERQKPLKCAGKTLQVYGAFRPDIIVAPPVWYDQAAFNIVVVIPELRDGYKFVRLSQGAIVFDGSLGWLRMRKDQDSQEPTVEQYWDRVRQAFSEYFSSPKAHRWEFSAKFPEAQQVDFGPLDDWKKREVDLVQAAVVDAISGNTVWEKRAGPNARNLREVTLQIGNFSRWSGGVDVIVQELRIMLTLPFEPVPLGSEYPLSDLGKNYNLETVRQDMVQKIRKRGFERKVAVHFKDAPK